MVLAAEAGQGGAKIPLPALELGLRAALTECSFSASSRGLKTHPQGAALRLGWQRPQPGSPGDEYRVGGGVLGLSWGLDVGEEQNKGAHEPSARHEGLRSQIPRSHASTGTYE